MIQHENRILLGKIISIDNKPSDYNKRKLKKSLVRTNKSSINFNRDMEHMRIAVDNSHFLTRLKSSKSVYSTKQWKRDFKNNRYLS